MALLRRLSSMLALAGLLALAPRARAVESSLISPPFPWMAYGRHLSFARVNVTGYLTPSGGSGGSVQTVTVPIYAAAGAPDGDRTAICTGNVRCEQIGTFQMQYALWQGYQQSYTTNRVGAAVLGGFQLTDAADAPNNYSVLQIYRDYYNPDGFIDGGNFAGKINGQIPDWNPNPTTYNNTGWNYGGSSYQYQYFDVPYEIVGISPLETVSFETALANVDAATGAVNILADFTWSLDTLTGHLTGQQMVFNPTASATLLSLYTAAYGPAGASYSSGILSYVRPLPEPGAWALLLVGMALTGAQLRQRRSAVRLGDATGLAAPPVVAGLPGE